jgi:hypothetical protein
MTISLRAGVANDGYLQVNGGDVLKLDAAGNLTLLTDPAWTSVPLTISTGGGTLTSANGTFIYKKLGRTVFYRVLINIVNNGTGAGSVSGSGIPAGVVPLTTTATSGMENAVTGKGLVGRIQSNGTIGPCSYTDATYPGVNGAQLMFSGSYESAS